MPSSAAKYPVTYDPTVFEVGSRPDAKRIILTGYGGMTPEERWQSETPYLLDLIRQHLPEERRLVLDYGCGIGRLAKALCESGTRVLGIDIALSMRILAPDYVRHENFAICHPSWIPFLWDMPFDAGLAVWVLQHVLEPRRAIAEIATLLSGGHLFVVNQKWRSVPVSSDKFRWGDDGLDVQGMLRERAEPVIEGELDPAAVGADLARDSFWGIYRF